MGKALVVDSANQGSIARGEPTTIVVAGGVPYFVDSSNNITAIATVSALSAYVTAGASDITISGLTTDGSPDFNADYVRTYDASAGGTKQVVLRDVSGWISVGVTQLSTGATSYVIASNLPANIREIMVVMRRASLSGTADLLFRLGINSGEVTTGYTSHSATGAGGDITSTTGFVIFAGSAAVTVSGRISFYRSDNNVWLCEHLAKSSTPDTFDGGGDVALSSAATTVYITNTITDTFDNGTVAVFYRF